LPKQQIQVSPFNYRYPIFYKIAIKAKPSKRASLYDIRKHKSFRVSKTCDAVSAHHTRQAGPFLTLPVNR
jgi:hypothetical protein